MIDTSLLPTIALGALLRTAVSPWTAVGLLAVACSGPHDTTAILNNVEYFDQRIDKFEALREAVVAGFEPGEFITRKFLANDNDAKANRVLRLLNELEEVRQIKVFPGAEVDFVMQSRDAPKYFVLSNGSRCSRRYDEYYRDLPRERTDVFLRNGWCHRTISYF